MYQTGRGVMIAHSEKCTVHVLYIMVADWCYRFSLKSAPLRKSYSCVSCKIAIKAMHKLAKCSCKLKQ